MGQSPLSRSGSGCIGSLAGGILGVVIIFSMSSAFLGGGRPQPTGFLPFDFISGLFALVMGLIAMMFGVAIGGVVGSAVGSMVGVSIGDAVITASEEASKTIAAVETPQAELERLRLRIAELELIVSATPADAKHAVVPIIQSAAPEMVDDVASEPLPLPVLWIGLCPACGSRAEMTQPRHMGKSHVCPICHEAVIMDVIH